MVEVHPRDWFDFRGPRREGRRWGLRLPADRARRGFRRPDVGAVLQDTTLATRDTTGAFCYSKFGVGPVVWYSYTAMKSELVDIDVTSDYYAEYVIAPSNRAGDSDNLWGDRQFRTTAGVTYLIGIYGLDVVRNSGGCRWSSAPPRRLRP